MRSSFWLIWVVGEARTTCGVARDGLPGPGMSSIHPTSNASASVVLRIQARIAAAPQISPDPVPVLRHVIAPRVRDSAPDQHAPGRND